MFFNKKKRLKVNGQIVKYEIENNKHYPVFAFDTLDGRRIVSRNKIQDDVKWGSDIGSYKNAICETKDTT